MKDCAGEPTPCSKSMVLVVLGLLLGSGSLQPVAVDATEPSPPIKATGDQDEVRGLLVFYVSERFIRSELEREIDRSSPVDRTIEGTRSQGTARTTAHMAVTLEPQEDGIGFEIMGQGTVETNTVGRNGAAIVRSNLHTPFTARVPILFDGTHFTQAELALQTDSRLRILSVESDLPGLRGRLVRKEASRRSGESLCRVQAISARLTERQLRKSIDELVDQSLQKLNRRLQTRRLLSRFMRAADGRWLRYSSSTDAFHIAWYPLLNPVDVPRCPLELGGNAAVQLWIHDRWANASGIDELPQITDNFESWLQKIFPNASLSENVPLPRGFPLPPIRLERIDDWFVVKSEPGEAPQ